MIHQAAIGRWCVGAEVKVASEGHWDWTRANGDVRSDVASVSVVRRDGFEPLLVVVLGPLCLTLGAWRV